MSFELDDRKVAGLIQMCEGRHLFVTRQENILSLCLVLFCVDFKRCTLQHSGEGTLELLDPDTHMIYVCAYADRHTQIRIKYDTEEIPRHRHNTDTYVDVNVNVNINADAIITQAETWAAIDTWKAIVSRNRKTRDLPYQTTL